MLSIAFGRVRTTASFGSRRLFAATLPTVNHQRHAPSRPSAPRIETWPVTELDADHAGHMIVAQAVSAAQPEDRQMTTALPIDRMIRTYPFAAINDAVADARSGATIKPVLTF